MYYDIINHLDYFFSVLLIWLFLGKVYFIYILDRDINYNPTSEKTQTFHKIKEATM